MKITHVITGMQKAAGTTTFVENVVGGLRAAGHNVEIVMSDAKFNHCDIMHIHGLWNLLVHKASRFAIKNNIPIIWSTHGMTAPWSMRHKLWKKLPAWLLYQKRDLKSAMVIHCTTEQEVEWNKSLGFKNCFIAPLGTHLPKIDQYQSRTPTHNSNYTLLFVGRIYPVKGLVNLIKAWKIVQTQVLNSQDLTIPFSNSNSELQPNHNWKLRIVGPDEAGHKLELESLVRELELGDGVEFAGPKFEAELSAEYDNCDCLVLPSFTENFGAAVVDALAHGKPCIASSFTPWQELTEYGCGWWVGNEPKALSAAIGEMVAMPDVERRQMGARGRILVEEKYTWAAVCSTIENAYLELIK